MKGLFMNDLTMIMDFIGELEKLKKVKRRNMTLDDGRFENSAEHSWHLAMMALVLADEFSINDASLLKIIKMLLVHDLGEIYTGDTFLFDEKARAQAYKKEQEDVNKLFARLPSKQQTSMHAIWTEFENGTTYEARFAASLDGLQPLLNHSITAPVDYNIDNIKVSQVYEKKYFIKTNTPALWPIAEEAIEKCIQKGLFC